MVAAVTEHVETPEDRQLTRGQVEDLAGNELLRCVTELLAEHFPGENPLVHSWEIQAARINLYYAPEIGRKRAKVITVEVTRRGRLNLHKFDEALRAQLEGYLIGIGVMQEKQRLSPHVDVADAPVDETVQ